MAYYARHYPWKELSSNVWHGAIFSCIPISHISIVHTLPVLSPLSSPTSPFYFTLPLPFPKEGMKKRSHCRQNAPNIWMQYQQQTYILFIGMTVKTGQMHNVLFVCPSVHSFVCYQLVNVTLQNFEWTDFTANWHKCSPGQGHDSSTSRVRRSKVKVTGRQSYVCKPGRDVILDPLSRVDTDTQWATEMLPMKREQSVAHSFCQHCHRAAKKKSVDSSCSHLPSPAHSTPSRRFYWRRWSMCCCRTWLQRSTLRCVRDNYSHHTSTPLSPHYSIRPDWTQKSWRITGQCPIWHLCQSWWREWSHCGSSLNLTDTVWCHSYSRCTDVITVLRLHCRKCCLTSMLRSTVSRRHC